MPEPIYGPPADPQKLYSPGADFPYLFRWLHWLLWPSLIVLTLTGLSEHAVSSPDWSLFSGVLPEYLWPGRVHLYHLWASLVFSPAVIAALWIYVRTRDRYRLAHFLLLVGGVALVLSGLVLATWPGPPRVYVACRWVHAVAGLLVVPLAFLWHFLCGLSRYRRALIPAFRIWSRPKCLPVLGFVPLVLITTCLILNGLPVTPPWRELTAKRIPVADVDTDELETLSWNAAEPLKILLAGGIAFEDGCTEVTLRALHNGQELFVCAEWLDPDEDRQYTPWEKTDDGWRHLITNEDDESTYYEDKFSLVFPAAGDWQFERFGCAVYCHAGGGRAYGYKAADRMVDVWHWKSTRTDPVGQVDDKYWSVADLSAKDIGRHGDPKQSGGYKKNVSQDKSHPAFLPDGPAAVKQGMISADHAVEYSEEAAARIPAETIVPGIVAAGAVGDRGDVACTSRHEDGRWRVYVRRKLDTGSQYDVKFIPGQPYPFGCAAFDRSSKRHAYEYPVYRLMLEP
ncbi:MAG: hypothetical protein JXB62_09250 [Pirellulales bacterium]|nr:hypothetical protein [Pirellulales bacterium]